MVKRAAVRYSLAMAKRKRVVDAPEGAKILVRNRRAFHDYQIHDRIEAGIQLEGSEVKSLRDSRGSLQEGYVTVRNGEAWLVGTQVKEYPWANQFNHDPDRDRRLLLHKSEIRKLDVRLNQRGFTAIPLMMYLKNGRIKVEIALVTGKRQFEKRDAARDATAKREIDQAMKRRRNG